MTFKPFTIKVFLLCLVINSCSTNSDEELNQIDVKTQTPTLKTNKLTLNQDPPIILYDDLPTREEDESLSNFILHGNKWNKTNLTYFHDKGTSDIINNEERNGIKGALILWSKVTPLVFTEVFNAQSADIVISFEMGDHGDNSPFDNGGNSGSNILAHAFFPPPNSGSLAGDIHFDDFENWTLLERAPFSGQPIDLVTVAAHEIGHALGLRHTDVPSALMYPIYNGSHRYLDNDDIQGIQALYGYSVPIITNTGSGCDDNKCIWITGKFNTNNSNRVELRKSTGNREIVGIYYTGEFDMNNNGTSITLRLKSNNEINLFFNEGLRVFVVDEYNFNWSVYGNNNVTTPQ